MRLCAECHPKSVFWKRLAIYYAFICTTARVCVFGYVYTSGESNSSQSYAAKSYYSIRIYLYVTVKFLKFTEMYFK